MLVTLILALAGLSLVSGAILTVLGVSVLLRQTWCKRLVANGE